MYDIIEGKMPCSHDPMIFLYKSYIFISKKYNNIIFYEKLLRKHMGHGTEPKNPIKSTMIAPMWLGALKIGGFLGFEKVGFWIWNRFWKSQIIFWTKIRVFKNLNLR